ncbi:MAG: CPBP family intramembrane metalloprotease [Oscillospiraceae bacterium]|nr:CPBP family intramembrane metalloprotease [Oscillospiraceae bacterium]
MNYFVKPNPNETVIGIIYFVLQLLILPSIILVGNMLLANPLPETTVQVLIFAVNFLAVLLIFRKFLVANFRFLLENPWFVLRCAGIGMLIYMVGNAIFSFIVTLIDPSFTNINDAIILEMVQDNFGLMTLGTVVLVPIAEECFYRVLMFRNVYDKSPWLAYALSMILFSLAHVVGYITMYDFRTLAICFFQYLPAGFALAWAYRRSGSIFASVLIHMSVNQMGMLLMR